MSFKSEKDFNILALSSKNLFLLITQTNSQHSHKQKVLYYQPYFFKIIIYKNILVQKNKSFKSWIIVYIKLLLIKYLRIFCPALPLKTKHQKTKLIAAPPYHTYFSNQNKQRDH
jgi:hypothetical protein